MNLPNPIETVARSSPKVKLALGAAGLLLFIVGVKRSLPKREEAAGHGGGAAPAHITPGGPGPARRS